MTIKDIAQEAGVSYQAVSAVLNNRPGCRVSAKRREQIMEIARKGGYQKNFAYTLFRRQKTNTMAVIPSTQSQSGEGARNWLICHILEQGNRRGFSTYFDNGMTNDAENNLARIRSLVQRGVENFIFLGTPCGYTMMMEELKKLNRNYIGFNSSFDRNLVSDSFSASLELVDFVRSQTGDNLRLLVPVPMGLHNSRLRAMQFRYPQPEEEFQRRFVRTFQIDPALERSEAHFRGGALAAEEIMRQAETPVGLVCHTDFAAAGAADWLSHHGYQLGRDAVITGFDNELVSRYAPYPISSAEADSEKIVQLLLEHVADEGEFQQTIPLKIWIRK